MSEEVSLKRLLSDYVRVKLGNRPSDRSELPVTDEENEIVGQLDATSIHTASQLSQFRQLSDDRQIQYDAYDELKSDPIISAALELYADDATQYDEQGRVIWVESEDENITKAANRLLDIFEIPERAWKHIYQACLYGDYYLKLYRQSDFDNEDLTFEQSGQTQDVRVVNDRKVEGGKTNYVEYVEDVEDPALIFDLRKRGKTAGFIEINREVYSRSSTLLNNTQFAFKTTDVSVYSPDRFVHIVLSESLSRTPETVKIDLGEDKTVEYRTVRGKSVLQDVYPVQRELQLLEDSLLLNRLTRSSLIRLLEIELGDMPKKEVNNYMRRIKNLIEQHVSVDKDTGNYKSYNSPGPIDNVIYIPTRNGKGSISVNNLGGDVNVRDIADIDYFNNKRSGALKIPKAYLGDDMDNSGLSNGGSLTRLSIRYARTIKRIQLAYCRAITTLLNLFFVDKKLDYVNKFTVRMTSPSTQEDLERNELIAGNVDLISSILDLTSSLEGNTQKKVLEYLVSNVLKMPEVANLIKEDRAPDEDVDIEGGPGGPSFDMNFDGSGSGDGVDISDAFEDEGSEDSGSTEGGFSNSDFAEFTDELS